MRKIRVMKRLIYIALCMLFMISASAENNKQRINNFIIKEHITSNGKVAIIAVDSLENALDHINGVFKFTINGFEQTLDFNDGVGVPSQPIEKSTFVYFKHKNQDKSTGKLYFLYKKDNDITPVKINGLLLIIIPALILLMAYAAKKLLSTFIVLAIIYGYFSFSKGLSVSQIIESALEIIGKLF